MLNRFIYPIIVYMINEDQYSYIQNIVNTLESDGFFTVNIFIGKDELFESLLRKSQTNLNNTGSFKISEEDLTNSISEVIGESVNQTLNSLIDQNIVSINGVDNNGDFLYAINQ